MLLAHNKLQPQLPMAKTVTAAGSMLQSVIPSSALIKELEAFAQAAKSTAKFAGLRSSPIGLILSLLEPMPAAIDAEHHQSAQEDIICAADVYEKKKAGKVGSKEKKFAKMQDPSENKGALVPTNNKNQPDPEDKDQNKKIKKQVALEVTRKIAEKKITHDEDQYKDKDQFPEKPTKIHKDVKLSKHFIKQSLFDDSVVVIKEKFAVKDGDPNINRAVALKDLEHSITKEKFDFLIKNRYSIEDIPAREWYLEQLSKLPVITNIDNMAAKELVKLAEQFHSIRDTVRTIAREIMKNKDLAMKLYKEEPNLAFKEFITNKMKKHNFTYREALSDTIKSSKISRKSVNEKLGIKND